MSYRSTRVAVLVCGALAWFGLLALLWRRRVARWAILALSVAVVLFCFSPGRGTASAESLRSAYAASLLRYQGVRYYWGGESSRGIDCSGLIRRGLIDTFLWQELRSADPQLVRDAFDLWWHDSTAAALGEGYRGLTVPVLKPVWINKLDHALLHPGDLAVTQSGLHIMAYLGDSRWIEADPGDLHVLILQAPSDQSPWLDTPMQIVRWKVLE